MNIEKKDIYLIVLSIGLITSIGFSIRFGIVTCDMCISPPPPETLVVGTRSGPYDLDPCDSWDKASNNVIRQVAETLFTYNLSHPDLPITNLLAESYFWDITNTIFTVNLRQGVKFHDYTDFNAGAVKWNLERLIYLMNHTGELPSDRRVVKIHSLYEFPDGSPIFNEILVLSNYTVEIHLNAPYAPILDAMCYVACSMLSPTSTPTTSIIDIMDGDIVGTGPYMYDYYIMDSEVCFTSFYRYWREEVIFDRMIFKIINDPIQLNYAMFAREIDVLLDPMTDLISLYESDPLISEQKSTSLAYHFICFNNKHINITWRKAMSYAINYTYVIEELLDRHAERSYGPISSGFGQYYDSGIMNTAPYFNLTIARQAIIDDPKINTIGLNANDDPNDPTWLSANLVSFNYTYYGYNSSREILYPFLRDWFDAIGVNLTEGFNEWWPFIGKIPDWYIPERYNYLQICYLVWGPDYLDPLKMLYDLYSNISKNANVAQVNDADLENMMNNAMEEIDNGIRAEIYKNISHYLAEELYPHAFLYHNKIYSVHFARLYGVHHNSLEYFYAYPIKCNLTWVPPF